MSTANAVQTATTIWNLDPVHSTAGFKHMMITNVKGQFTAVTGVVKPHRWKPWPRRPYLLRD